MFKVKKEYSDYAYKSLRLPTELIDKLQNLAHDNNLSFNKMVIQCVEYALEHIDEKNNIE